MASVQDMILPPELPAGPTAGARQAIGAARNPGSAQADPSAQPGQEAASEQPQAQPDQAQGPGQGGGAGGPGVGDGDRLQQLLSMMSQKNQAPPESARQKRMRILSDFMNGTLVSIGDALTAGANAPPGQRKTAALGAALAGGPKYAASKESGELKQQQQDLALQKANNDAVIHAANADAAAKRADAATQQATVAGQRAEISDRQMQSMSALHQAQMGLLAEQQALAAAKTDTERKTLEARIAKLQAEADSTGLKLIPGAGVMDVHTKQIVPGTEPRDTILITPELAKEAFKDPVQAAAMEGKRMKLGELTPFLKPKTALATTEDAVTLINMEDGSPIRVIGKPRGLGMAGLGYLELDARGKSMIDAVREKILTGQYTKSEGLSALGGVKGGLGGALVESMANDLVLPEKVRIANNDIERAKNLMAPIYSLVDEINATSDLTEKAKTSFQLEQYIHAIGTQFARARGERGVVTDRDVDRVSGLLGGWKSANFAPDYARENLKLIEGTFDRDQDALLSKYFTKFKPGGAAVQPGQPGQPTPSVSGAGAGTGAAPASPTFDGSHPPIPGAVPYKGAWYDRKGKKIDEHLYNPNVRPPGQQTQPAPGPLAQPPQPGAPPAAPSPGNIQSPLVK